MGISSQSRTEWARRVLDGVDAAQAIARPSLAEQDFDVAEAYAVSELVTRARIARGERPIGWKVGFTNRTIWDEYGVRAPIFGPVYASTFAAVADGEAVCQASRFHEPRIEPEIALRLKAAPQPGMDDAALLSCVDAVAHGYEIVQSPYPGWIFSAADAVAGGALHGAYFCGPFVTVDHDDAQAWLARLGGFRIRLERDGETLDEGDARNILGGPLPVLLRLAEGLAEVAAARGLDPASPGGKLWRLAPGDLVTTGTVTRAFPVAPGETWRSFIDGLPVEGLRLRVA